VVVVDLLLGFVDGDDFGDLLDDGDDLVLALVVIVDEGFVNLDYMEVMLVHVVLVDSVLMKIFLMSGVDVDVVFVQMISQNDLLMLIVLVNLVFMMIEVLDACFVGVVIEYFVDMSVLLNHFRLLPTPSFIPSVGRSLPPSSVRCWSLTPTPTAPFAPSSA